MSLASQVAALATAVGAKIKTLEAELDTKYGPGNPPPTSSGTTPGTWDYIEGL